jgi:hypothetical protein
LLKRQTQPGAVGQVIVCAALALVALAGCTSRNTDVSGSEAVRTARTSEALLSDPAGVIDAHAAKLGAAVVGAKVGALQTLPIGLNGWYWNYTKGTIVVSDAFGAWFLATNIANRWFALQNEFDFWGDNLLRKVGLPLGDTTPFRGAPSVLFERGQIIDNGGGKALYGEIYTSYRQLNDDQLDPVDLGLPTGEEVAESNLGRYQAFEHGQIHWGYTQPATAQDPRPVIRAWPVMYGPIFDAWLAGGGSAGALGFPEGLPQSVVAPGVPDGSMVQHFLAGTIAYNPSYGAFQIYQNVGIAAEYSKQGGPAGFPSSPNAPLGFPTAEQATTALGDTYQQFENGLIVYPLHAAESERHPQTFVNGSWQLGLLWSGGSDCLNGPFCTGLDAYWHIYVDYLNETHPNFVRRVTLDLGNGDDPSLDVHDPGHPIETYTPGLRFRIFFGGSDEDLTSHNDPIPDRLFTYSIDNLWGRLDSNGDPLSTTNQVCHDGNCLYAVWQFQTKLPYDPTNQWASEWWSFHNWHTDTLERTTMAKTFYDVESEGFQPFISLFYELYYRKMARAGVCFGMCLEAINAKKGLSAIDPEPIYQYFDDTQDGKRLTEGANDAPHRDLIDLIHVKHGYQASAEAIEHLISLRGSGGFHDPIGQFGIGIDWHEPMIVAMTSTYLWRHGHAVLATNFDNYSNPPCIDPKPEDNFCYRIDILNPNIPYSLVPAPAGPEPKPMEFIQIAVTPNSYYYYDSNSGVTRTGNGGSSRIYNGRMYMQPYHLFDSRPHSPIASFWELARDGVFVILGDGGTLTQATDDGGRTLFAATNNGQAQWDDLLEGDGAIPLTPIPLMGEGADDPTEYEMYAGHRLAGATHTYDVTAAAGLPTGTVFQALFDTGRQSSVLQIPSTEGKPDQVTMSNIAADGMATALTIAREGATKAVNWTFGGHVKSRWIELTGLQMVPAQMIRLRTERAGYTVHVDNAGPTTTATLRVNSGPTSTPVSRGTITIPGFRSSTIEIDGGECATDAQCPTGQSCDAGACRTPSCAASDPFGSLTRVFPGMTSVDGFTLSPDGRTAYVSKRTSNYYEIFSTTRADHQSAFGALTLVTNLNTLAGDKRAPFMTVDGLKLYFYVVPPGGASQIMVATRSTTGVEFSAPQAVTGLDGRPHEDPYLSPDGTTVFLTRDPPSGARQLWQTTVNGNDFGALVGVGVNSGSANDFRAVITRDQRRLYFGSKRPGYLGDHEGDVWVSDRADTTADFVNPTNLEILDSTGSDFPVAVSPDGCSLYIASDYEHRLATTTSYEIYEARRQPTPSQVTVTLNLTSASTPSGSVGAPFNCQFGNTGTCTLTQPFGTRPVVYASRQATWSGACAPNGNGNPSTDGIVDFRASGTCNVKLN